jgi:hypothetical protein
VLICKQAEENNSNENKYFHIFSELNPTDNSYTIKLVVTLFSLIFTGGGTAYCIGYMGCDSTKTKRPRARASNLIGILTSLGEGERRRIMFCIVMEASMACNTQGFSRDA